MEDIAANRRLSGKGSEPGQHQRQTTGKFCVDESASDQDHRWNGPMPESGDVLSELIGRRQAGGRQQKQRGGDAEVRRIKDVLSLPVADGRAKDHLGGQRQGRSKDDGSNPLVGIDQHGAGQTGDDAGRKKIDQVGPASCEPGRAAVHLCIEPFQQEGDGTRGENADNGLSIRLLKAEDGVTENGPEREQAGEVPQGKEAHPGIFAGVEIQCRVCHESLLNLWGVVELNFDLAFSCHSADKHKFPPPYSRADCPFTRKTGA